MNQRWLYIVVGVLLIGVVATAALTAPQGVTPPLGDQVPPTRAAREERAIQESRRQQLAEKEAALAAKEGELKKLGEKIDAQLKSLEETKKKYEELLKAEEERQKQLQGERVTKMVKLFKTLKAAQSAKLLDGMEEAEVRLILDRLDTKTVAKLVPNISQPRTIRWVNENLRKRAEKE